MTKALFDTITSKTDAIISDFYAYLSNNRQLINLLALVALAAYGFELFNFNLTIDEEIHAIYSGPVSEWVSQGRWGMYLLNKFLLPYTVMPFVPLFLALIFHIGAILLLLKSWQVESRLDQTAIGIIGIAFPTMAYMYTFSTINYGIGIGLFCVAASLLIYSRAGDRSILLAFIPAAFSISIYQGFILALLSAFLVYIISQWRRSGQLKIRDLILISLILILATSTYLFIQKTFLTFGGFHETSYTSQFFDVAALRDNFAEVLTRILYTMANVYFGDKSIYAIRITILGILIAVLLAGWGAKLLQSKLSIMNKIIIAIFSLALLLLPFASGLLMRGSIAMRFLVALPIVMSGLTMLGMCDNPRIFRITVAALTGFAVLQFVMSTNRLFGSSYMALQEDRLLAVRLIERIDIAKTEDGVRDLKYLEIIGYLNRPATELIPHTETFGASFFEWDQGSAGRVLYFLQTIGYSGLSPLPLERRAEMIEVAESMPIWPEKGSVGLSGDIVLIKFGAYSNRQTSQICSLKQNRQLLRNQDFCK